MTDSQSVGIVRENSYMLIVNPSKMSLPKRVTDRGMHTIYLVIYFHKMKGIIVDVAMKVDVWPIFKKLGGSRRYTNKES